MISRQLATIRKQRKLTMKDVAEAMGVSLSAYQKYENGTRDVSTETLSRFADFYGVSTDYLLGRDTGEPAPIDALAGSFNMSALEQKILEGYLNLPAAMRGDLMDFLQNAVREVMRDTQND